MPYLDGLAYVQHGSNFQNQFSIMPGRVLGKGASGVVHVCVSLENGEQFACKVIPKFASTETDVREWRRTEVSALHLLTPSSASASSSAASTPPHVQQARKAGIAQLVAVFEDDETIRIVTELCDGGPLGPDQIPAPSERQAAGLLKQIMECILECHRRGVIHRDVKPENFVFLDYDGPGDGEDGAKDRRPRWWRRRPAPVLKMVDFGVAVFHRPGQKHSELVGSPSYAAPEILHGRYGPEVDVWGAGVILYALLCGALPFTAEAFWESNHQLFLDTDRWRRVSDGAKTLVRQMLNNDPQRRPAPEQVLKHPWVKRNASSAASSSRSLFGLRCFGGHH